MEGKANTSLRAVVAMISVKSVPSSIEFYKRIGFSVGNTFTPANQSEPSWAWLEAEGAQLMITAARQMVSDRRSVVIYIYCEDVKAKHAELQKLGLQVGPLQYPFYSPNGEFSLTDPDGYLLVIAHT